MSTPELRFYQGKYYAFWSSNRRSKRKSMGTAERIVAEERFAHWLLLGGHRDEIPEEIRQSLTVGELWLLYYEQHVLVSNVDPSLAANSWKNLSGHFSDRAPSTVDQDYVNRFVHLRTTGKLGRKAKPVTVRRELAILRACLNWCAHPRRKPRLIEKADVPDFDLPADSQPRDRWLSAVEISRLFEAARTLRQGERMGRGERFLWLALETAARQKAICELTWDRVDFETGMIHYAVPGRRQTKKRRVSVPISAALMPQLRRMYAERVNDYVLDNESKIWATVQIIVERAGLAPKSERKNGAKPKSTGISPHTFRHTAATHMARRGVPLYDIAGVLGNTLAMVEKVYAKHCPGRLKAAVDSISSDLEPVE